MNQKIKFFFLTITALTTTFSFLYAAGPTTGPVTGVADLPDHGWGRVSRVNNKTNYAMDVYFDKTIHDLLPEGTIAVLRSLDPKLGKEGKLLRVLKEGDEVRVKADATSSKDRTTQFEIKRRLAPDLTDWLGFSSLSNDNNNLRINPTNYHAVVDTKDFQQDAHQPSHWKLQGKDLSECRIESRLGGFLQNLTFQEEFALGPDEEKVEYAQDLWCCNYPISWRVTNATYGLEKPPAFDVTSGEYWGIRTWQERDYYEHLAWKGYGWHYKTLSERKAADIRGWVRDRINERGFFEIPANANGAFGDSCPGFPKTSSVKVRVFGDIEISVDVPEGQAKRVEVFNDGRVQDRLEQIRRSKSQALIEKITYDLRTSGAVSWGPSQIHTRVGDPYPGAPKVAQVDIEIDGAKRTFTGSDAQGLNISIGGAPFRFSGDKWESSNASLKMIAVGNKYEIWGVSPARELWRYGDVWEKQQTNMPVSFVSVSSAGDVFFIHGDDNSVWQRTKEGWKKIPTGQLKRVSARNAQEIWGIGTNDLIYKYDFNTGEWTESKAFGTTARDVSVAFDGTLWATNTNNQLFKSEDGGKIWTLIPMDAWYVAARNKQEAYIIKGNNQIWKYLNGKWSQIPGAASHISCASGVNVTKILAKREKRSVETFTVRTPDGKPTLANDEAKFAIEIIKLGMGGGIPAKSAGDFIKIPVFKNPRVAGFAQYQLTDINQGSLIKVNPLRSQGAAWLESTLALPGQATLCFNARPGSAGDIQILFGQEVSNSFVWKIVIGGWRNTKAAIMKRFYEGGKPKDVFVCEVTRDQNPLAAAIPGTFTPYWVSINQGLILVGVGNIGENPFMAWRDPNPPTDVNICGFGSHKMPVEYTEVQILPAVDVQGNRRTYKKDSAPITVPAGTSNIKWLTSLPFRIMDRGSLATSIDAADTATLILGNATSLAKPHYAIVFGDDENKKISLKKWIPAAKRYLERASLSYETYPELICKAGKKMRFWVSLNAGTIALGSGATGENTLLVIQDLNPHSEISRIGIGSFSKNPATFSDFEIGSAVEFGIEKQLEGYKQAKATFKYAGNMTIVTPFEYQFSQEEQSVKLTDLVNDSTYYPGGTPQQGAFYDFMLSILEDGTPKLDWVNDPTNPKKLELERRVQKMNADAELARMTKDIMDKDAAIQKSIKLAEAQRIRTESDIKQQTAETKAGTQKELAQAQGDIKRAEYNAALTTGDKIAQAGTQIASATSSSGNPIIAGIGIGVGSALIAGGLVKSALAEGTLRQAAEEDARGVQAGVATKLAAADEAAADRKKAALTEEQAAAIEAQLNRKALERESQAADLEYQANLLNGEVSAFRKIDAYVYTDQAPRTPLGSSSIPDEAVENRKTLEEKVLNESMRKRPTTRELFEELLSLYKFGLNLVTHFYVIDKKSTKQQIFDTINALVAAYPKLYGSDTELNETVHNDLINLLMAARNNPYLLDLNIQDERNARDVWYSNVIQLSRALISKGQSSSITLNSTFGEYIWLTEKAAQDDVAEISFEAEGLNDIFIGFADETVPVRNTSKEFYEVVLGAWDNTRHVVRLKSLDRSVFEVTKAQRKDAMLTGMEFDTYSIRFDHGKITVTKGKGKKVIMEWQDPYPITGLRRIGIATWNSPITFRNIALNGKEVGQHDVNLESLSRDKPTEAIYQAVDLFNELQDAIGKDAMETTEDEDSVTLMDTLEETIVNAADNGFKKRRTMSADEVVDFATALDSGQNWLADDKNYKKAQFYLTTMVGELGRKGVTLALEDGNVSTRQTVTKLETAKAEREAAVQQQVISTDDVGTEAAADASSTTTSDGQVDAATDAVVADTSDSDTALAKDDASTAGESADDGTALQDTGDDASQVAAAAA